MFVVSIFNTSVINIIQVSHIYNTLYIFFYQHIQNIYLNMIIEKIRVINTKTGKVKFVTPQVAADTAGLFSYGFIVQNLAKKNDELLADGKAFIKEIEDEIYSDPNLLEIAEQAIGEKVKGKPGRKPKQ